MLAGIGSTAQFASRNFGWTEEAERNGFMVVFPAPIATDPSKPPNKKTNITFWQMRGSRTRILAPDAMPVDDEGYLMAVLRDVLRRDHPDPRRVFFAGFSSGSGMVQLLASRHPKEIRAIAAVATPLMDPPTKLARPVGVLYIHGDKDEQFSGFETLSPHFATTPHGNWVTWGYLDGCQTQTAEKTSWGVRFSWQGCRNDVPVIADFIVGLGHEWAGSLDSKWNPPPANSSSAQLYGYGLAILRQYGHQIVPQQISPNRTRRHPQRKPSGRLRQSPTTYLRAGSSRSGLGFLDGSSTRSTSLS